MATVKKQVTVESDVWERLEPYMKKNGIKFSALISALLTEYLKEKRV